MIRLTNIFNKFLILVIFSSFISYCFISKVAGDYTDAQENLNKPYQKKIDANIFSSHGMPGNVSVQHTDALGVVKSYIVATETKPVVRPISVHSETSNIKKQEKERDIMEEALLLIEEAKNSWQNRQIEDALDMLDQAYALILETDGAPDIARQKDDLRLLISKQIVAIYASMSTSTVGKRGEIPYVLNADVEKEIRLFQTVEKDFFVQSYRRSAIFRPIILKELKNAGLPEELSWLPLVESGFKAHALSRARALGIWQFISSTGYKYGLNRDEWIDERMDVEKSTIAAIDYLKELHNMFGDWLTALAAYNCGEGRVIRVISKQHINHFDRFWDLYRQLPQETARYVPRFLATLHIVKDPQKYGFTLEENTDQKYIYERVKTSKSMRLQDIAKHMGVSEDFMYILNAELRQKMTPDKEYELKVPYGTAWRLASVIDEIPFSQKPKQKFITHTAKRGETIVSIARKYRTSAGIIMSHNNLSSRREIRTGQKIIIPFEERIYAESKNKKKKGKDGYIHIHVDSTKYSVKKGDTLASIAKKFNTSVTEIEKNNKIDNKKLKPGQVLMINNVKEPSRTISVAYKDAKQTSPKFESNNVKNKEQVNSATYTVKRGDCLGKIAKENGVSLKKLAELNKIAFDEAIQPGQVIKIR